MFGYISSISDDALSFDGFYDDGDPYTKEKILFKDIVSIEINTKYTKYIEKLIRVKNQIASEEKTIDKKDEILKTISDLYQNQIIGRFELLDDNLLWGYVIGYNNQYVVIRQLNTLYNIDEGINYYPIEMLSSIILHVLDYDVYPLIYQDSIVPERLIDLPKELPFSFFQRHLTDKKLVSIQNSTDFEKDEMSVGYVQSVDNENVVLRAIRPYGDTGDEINYHFDKDLIFTEGGFYLKKVALSTQYHLYEQVEEEDEIYHVKTDDILSDVKKALASHEILTLFSDEAGDEYFESTGYVLGIKEGWIKMHLYDMFEDDWYDYYRQIKDFTGVRHKGYTELLAAVVAKEENSCHACF